MTKSVCTSSSLGNDSVQGDIPRWGRGAARQIDLPSLDVYYDWSSYRGNYMSNPVPHVSRLVRPDLISAIEAMPAAVLLGIVVRGFDAAGRSVIEMPVKSSLTFDGRVVQGGIVGVLADFAGVSAAACALPEGWLASTTSFEVSNIAPAVGTLLIAVGCAVKASQHTGVSKVDVYAGGPEGQPLTLVCVAKTTCRPFQIG
jgi:uncharacterized protein (TIGR00369 family)